LDRNNQHPESNAVLNAFFGFRNAFPGALLKLFFNFWTKFIPETGTSFENKRKGLGRTVPV